jgi:hypothetical protein
MGIPISVWGRIPNRVAPHTGLVFDEIWGVTYTHTWFFEPSVYFEWL